MAAKKLLVKFGSINICGLSDKSRILLDKYVDEEKFDALFVQETIKTKIEEIQLTNMKVLNDNNNSVNRGVALYVNNKFTLTELREINEISKNIDSSWGLGVINNKRYVLGSAYVKQNYKNGIDDIIKMLDKAYDFMKIHKAVGVILCGDLNSRHITWGDHCNDYNGKKLFDKLDTSRFQISTAPTPTFLAKNGSSYIDLAIMTTNLTENLELCKTDINVNLYSGAPDRGHVPLITQLNVEGSVVKRPVIKKLNLDKINWQRWSSDLDTIFYQNEDYLENISEASELGAFIDQAVQTITKKHGEMKTVSDHSKPFWTPELNVLCNEMREARKRYNRRNTDPNYEKFQDAKEKFDEARKNAAQNFILEKTKNLNNAQKRQFWKEFKRIFYKKSDNTIEPLIDSDGNILDSSEDIENCLFGTFFQGQHLKEEQFDEIFYRETNRIYNEIIGSENNEIEENGLNSQVTLCEIKTAIKNYKKSGKSSDKDDFNPIMFRHLGEKALHHLQKLYNLCLDTSKWVWTKAEVIFLRKAGKSTYTKPGSYRPISISPYIGKLFEKILAKRIQNFLERLGLHDPDQEGFMEGRNTIRYLNRLILGIKSDIQKKLTSICLFIDYEKAFDSVWKKGLIVKLHSIGIQGKIIHLLNDFLVNRNLVLNTNGVIGQNRSSLDIGLPQGSALSPILFRIYVMDLASELNGRQDISIFKFADDGTIKVTSSNTPDCVEKMKQVLQIIDKWTRKWRMVINCQPDKTEFIGFSTAERNTDLIPESLLLGEKSIKRVKHTKVLGVIVDEELNFKEHSSMVYKKLAKIWGMISSHANRHWGFKSNTMLQIIKTLWLPSLFYAGHIWINTRNIEDINSLFYKIIKSIVGAVFNIRQSYAEMILGLPPLCSVNEVNKIKHYLKINMTRLDEDRLRDFVKCELHINETSEVHHSMRLVFKFLRWKVQNYPKGISPDDKHIIQSGLFSQYFSLSTNSCKYTKEMMYKYQEYLWQKIIQNELQINQMETPIPKCRALDIKPGITREEEVLAMSMLYPNNLLNSFLNRTDPVKFPNLLCSCQEESETIHHILFRCRNVNLTLRDELFNMLQRTVGEGAALIESPTVLLKASKSNHQFIGKICEVIKQQFNHLRTQVQL